MSRQTDQTISPKQTLDHSPQFSGLRVLAFCDYMTSSSCGGAEVVAREIYRRLASWGAVVTVVTSVPAGHRPQEVTGVRVVAVPTLNISRVLGAQAALSRRMFRTAAQVAREVRAHVLHANSLHFQSSIAAARVQRSSRVPLVTTAHIGSVEHLNTSLRLATSFYERTAGRFVLGRTTRAIAVAPSVADHLLALGVPFERVDVVPNGLDHTLFFAGHRPPGPSVPLVVFVGRLIANKGPHVLLEALVTLHRSGFAVRAEFIGEGPMRPRLERAARAAGLNQHVRFVGYSPEVAVRLRQADVLVRPSFTEGMPLGVLEAMACGVCVVASDLPGNAYLVQDGENGALFPGGDAGALAQVLRSLVSDVEERERLATAGRRTATRFSWDSTAAATGRILAASAGWPAGLSPG